MPVALVFLGPPGGGKTAVGGFFQSLGFVSFSSSKALIAMEREDVDFARSHPVAKTIASGKLCCNEALITAVRTKLPEKVGSFYCDGAIRVWGQVQPVIMVLREKVGLDGAVGVIQFECPDEICLERIALRRAEMMARGKKPRDDDRPERAKERLRIYRRELFGILEEMQRHELKPLIVKSDASLDCVVRQSAAHLMAVHANHLPNPNLLFC